MMAGYQLRMCERLTHPVSRYSTLYCRKIALSNGNSPRISHELAENTSLYRNEKFIGSFEYGFYCPVVKVLRRRLIPGGLYEREQVENT